MNSLGNRMGPACYIIDLSINIESRKKVNKNQVIKTIKWIKQNPTINQKILSGNF